METERSDMGEFHRQYKDAQQERRKNRLPIRTEEILNLSSHGYIVEKKTDYQYRINGIIDLFPIHALFHHIKRNKRGKYNPKELLNFIKQNLN